MRNILKINRIFNLQYFLLVFAFAACARLDDNLYNQKKLDSYRFDAYAGEVDFHLDSSFDIPVNMIHLLTLQSNDNGDVADIKAVYIGNIADIATKTVILYCHGNYQHMDFYWPRAKLLANTGTKNKYGVLMMDYRGFGMSDGKPSESGMYADVDSTMQWLKSQGLTNDRLVVYGFSLGSAPATQLSAHTRSMTPAKLILEAPFASAEAMVQDSSVLALPGSYFTDLSIDNAEEIKSVAQPLLWIHGTDDHFLRIATHGEPVYENHPGPRKFAVRVAGAGHDSVPATLGFGAYLQTIEDFMSLP